MRKHKYQKRKVEYAEGYNHYDKHRNIQVIFLVNEAERNLMEDLVAVSGVGNLSDFIRGQVFRAYGDLSAEQKEKLKEVASWRAANDNNNN